MYIYIYMCVYIYTHTHNSFDNSDGRAEDLRCLTMQEMWVLSLGQKGSLEKEMATHSRILTWIIPKTEEPGGYNPQSHRE